MKAFKSIVLVAGLLVVLSLVVVSANSKAGKPTTVVFSNAVPATLQQSLCSGYFIKEIESHSAGLGFETQTFVSAEYLATKRKILVIESYVIQYVYRTSNSGGNNHLFEYRRTMALVDVPRGMSYAVLSYFNGDSWGFDLSCS